LLNNEVFLNVAGIGFDAEVRRINVALPNGGIGAYAKSVVQAYWQSKPLKIRFITRTVV